MLFAFSGRGGGGRCSSLMMSCAGCDKPIMDKFLLNVLDRAWHAECVKCVDCHGTLSEKCYSRDGKILCKPDFYRLVVFFFFLEFIILRRGLESMIFCFCLTHEQHRNLVIWSTNSNLFSEFLSFH